MNKMNTEKAIEFLENDVLTILIIDQKVDEYYKKIKGIIDLLQQGEKYRWMWKYYKSIFVPTAITELTIIKNIEQKYFPKEASQEYKGNDITL